MASLFQGDPQRATSYVSSTSEYPKWMQDAIYNQIQLSQNIANRPYQEYNMPTVAELSPLQQQAYQKVVANQNAWQPGMQAATAGMQTAAGQTTAPGLTAAQTPFLRTADVGTNLNAANQLFGQAGQMDIVGAANPYLQAAGQTAPQNIGAYMSPYQQGVLDVIARQGTRNLTENILPGVSDAFIRAGQFGSGRMGEFGSRAVRDTQEAILNQQAQALQQGYGQAMTATQADLARQGQLASTAGQLTGQQLQQLANLGQLRAQAGLQQQNVGMTAAQAAQQAQAGDITRNMSGLQGLAELERQQAAMRSADVAALESAGVVQQGQMQNQLNAAKAQFDAARIYPQQQADWLSTQIRGLAPITPSTQTQSGATTGQTYSPSPLSQLASGVFAFRGLTS